MPRAEYWGAAGGFYSWEEQKTQEQRVGLEGSTTLVGHCLTMPTRETHTGLLVVKVARDVPLRWSIFEVRTEREPRKTRLESSRYMVRQNTSFSSSPSLWSFYWTVLQIYGVWTAKLFPQFLAHLPLCKAAHPCHCLTEILFQKIFPVCFLH